MGEAPQAITTTQEPPAAPALGIWELAWPAILNNLLHALIADYMVKATMLTLRFRGGRWKTVIKS